MDEQRRFEVPRRFWVRGGALVTLGLIAYLIFIVLQRPTKTPLIALAVLDYDPPPTILGDETPWPPNSWVFEDFEHLKATNTDNLEFLPVESRGEEFKFRREDHEDPLVSRLIERLESDSLRPGQPQSGSKVLLVYLSVNTTVNAQGQPCLIASDADPLDDSTWLPFEELLSRLAKTRKDIRKVVFFDCGRLDVEPTLGLGKNTFAEQAAELVKTQDPPNLWFLFSHSRGQKSWSAPELGGSAFGFFLAEGLNGHARGNDKFISLRELNGFVAANVEKWVMDHRADDQSPVLSPPLTSANDFALAFATDTNPAPPVSLLNDRDTYDVKQLMEGLDEAWLAFESKLQEITEPDRVSATARGSIVRKLCRMEQECLAGQKYKFAAQDPITIIAPMLQGLRIRPPTPQVYPSSLPQYAWRSMEVPEAERKAWETVLGAPVDAAALKELFGPLPEPKTVEAVLGQMLAAYAPPSTDARLVAAITSCRDAAERAACPVELPSSFVDLRFLDWTRKPLTALDARRRLLEDRLFAGEWDSLETEFERLTDDYRQQAKIAGEVSRAYSTVVECLTEMVDVGRWPLYLPGLNHGDADARLRQLNESLEKLVVGLEAEAADPAALQDLLQAVRADRDRLNNYRGQIFGQLVAQLGATSTSVEGSRMRNALSAATIPSHAFSASDRKMFHAFIRTGAFDIGQQQAVALASGTAAKDDSTPAEATGGSPGWHQRESRWLRRLATGSFQLPEGAGPETIRESLAAFLNDYTKLTAFEKGAASVVDLESALRLVHVAACGRDLRPPRLKGPVNDESSVLAALQLSRAVPYVQWLVQRTIDDFWGPPPGSDNGGLSFFERVARQQLAQPLSLPPAVLDGLNQALERAVKAAGEGPLKVSAGSLSFNIDEKSPLAEDLASARTVAISLDPRTHDGLVPQGRPEGVSAAWIVDRQGGLVSLDGRNRQPLELQPKDLSLSVTSEDGIARSDGGEIRALFRGHYRAEPLRVSRIQEESFDVEMQITPPDPPTIVVEDNVRVRPVVYFVLDCSHSMLTADGDVGEDGKRGTRWVDATSTLRELLDGLSRTSPGRFDVGLMAFGHRFRLGAKGNELSPFAVSRGPDRFRQSSLLQSISGKDVEEFRLAADAKKLFLCNLDIEILAKPEPFARKQFNELSALLSGLQPFAQTPLYGAIKLAAEDLARIPDRPRRIIVISDGMNQLVKPSGWAADWSGGVTFIPLRSAIGTLKDRKDSDIQIDVVGVGQEFKDSMTGLSKDESGKANGDDKAAYGNLKEVANVTYAEDRVHLFDFLQRSLAPLSYRVVRADNASEASEELMLGREWTASSIPKAPEQYLVKLFRGAEQVAEQRVILEGGERLRLVVDRPRSGSAELRLRFPRYGFVNDADPDDPDGIGVNDDSEIALAHPYAPYGDESLGTLDHASVIVHQPKIDDTGAGRKFPVSIQSGDDEKFSPRPAWFWVQATPDVPRGQQRTFNAFDRALYNRKAGRPPAPLVEVHVPDWPAQAINCKLDVAFSYAPFPSDFESDQLKPGDLPPIPSLSPITFRLRMDRAKSGEFVVIVTETHPAPTDRLNAIVTMSPAPSRIRRRFFSTSPRVDHEFYFDSPTLPGDARLTIISRETFDKHAEKLPRSVFVRAITD